MTDGINNSYQSDNCENANKHSAKPDIRQGFAKQPSKPNKRHIGKRQEDLAAAFLTQHGVMIIDRNFHDGRKGEIDLIGYDDQILIFVEVKYRSSHRFGTPEEAVTPAKQRTICKVASFYLYQHHKTTMRVRFDVVAITKVSSSQVYVRWIKDAFPYQGTHGRW